MNREAGPGPLLLYPRTGNDDMRNLLISFIGGCVLGIAVTVVLLLSSQKPSEESFALETLDYVINDWTGARDGDYATAKLGFPGARVGFIPDTVYALARRVDSVYRVPKGVVISQWILESRWGTRDLGTENYFGHSYAAVRSLMKNPRFVWRRDKIMVEGKITTGPPVRFAQYNDMAECFDTHGKYLSRSTRYKRAFSTNSPESFAKALSEGGYASDPGYAVKLVVIMRRYRL